MLHGVSNSGMATEKTLYRTLTDKLEDRGLDADIIKFM